MTTNSGLGRGFPTLNFLFRWAGRSRRRKWTVVAVLLAMVFGPPLWWWMQLVGLPDIGEPFDVAAFRAFRSPTTATPICSTSRRRSCSSH